MENSSSLYTHVEAEPELEDDLLLEPPDPVDLLIASTEDLNAYQKARPLDFVRAKVTELKKENKRLRDRVSDLEQTLSIVQTAQDWTIGKGMSPEQAEKMKEIKALLEQAKRARKEIHNFSNNSQQALFEKLRTCKSQLRREQEEKREMKGRLVHALDHAKAIREQNRQLVEVRQRENERWQEVIRDMKEGHRRKLQKLSGDAAVADADRHDQLKDFGEQVMGDLSALQQHLKEVRQETIDAVVVESDADNQILADSGEAEDIPPLILEDGVERAVAEEAEDAEGAADDGYGDVGPSSPDGGYGNDSFLGSGDFDDGGNNEGNA